MEQNNFRKSVVHGLSWTFLNQIFSQLVSLGLSIVLARYLTPGEFGILAMIVIFTNFARIFIDFGFSTALIQKKNVTENGLSTVFWFSVFSGSILTLGFFLGAEIIADFYDQPVLSDITKALSFTFIISSLSAVQGAMLVRELSFKLQTVINWGATVISSSIAIVLAFNGFGVWSLVVQSLMSSCLISVLYWFTSSWRPAFIFRIIDLKEMYKFGGSVAGTSVFNYWSRNMDNLMIGKLLGEGPLGIYSRAYSLMLLPVTNITGAVTRVMFPAFSSIQDDIPRVKSIYLRISRTIAFISFPLMFGLCAVSEPFILFTYGPKWADIIPVLQILSILGAFQSVLSLNGVIYNSQGRADLALKVTIVLNAVLLLAFYLGIKVNGIIGLSWAYFIVAGIGSIPVLYYAARLINVSIKEQARNLAKIFFASLIMMAIIFLLSKEAYISSLHFFMQLLILIFTGVVIYAILIIFFKEEVYKESLEKPIKRFLFNLINRIR